jgi:hypothetical protein
MGNVTTLIASPSRPTTIARSAPTPIAIAIAIVGVSPAITVAGVAVARVIPVIDVTVPIGHRRSVSIRQRCRIAIGHRSGIGIAITHRSGITRRPTAAARRPIAPVTGKGGRGK